MTENSDWSDLETQLQETKNLLEEVEQRFLQVRRDSIEQQDLLKQQEIIKQQLQEQKLQEQASDHRLNANHQLNDRVNSQNPNSKIRRKPSQNERISANSLSSDLKRQLQEISDRLEQIEADLESRLLSWSSFREPFWQVVRFGGLGVVIGIILRSCVN